MHDHDLDLIAAYADGSLSDPTSAEALVASCERCAEEHRAQTTAIRAMAGFDFEPLSEIESALIRRRVSEAIDAPPPVQMSPRREPGWWQRHGMRVAAVAATVFVGVGVLGVAGRMMTAADETAEFANVASGLESPSADFATTTAASAERTAAQTEMASGALAGEPVFIDLGKVERSELLAAIEEHRRSNQLFDADTSEELGATGGDGEPDVAESASCDVPLGSAVVITAVVDGRPITVSIPERTGEPVAIWIDTCEPADLG